MSCFVYGTLMFPEVSPHASSLEGCDIQQQASSLPNRRRRRSRPTQMQVLQALINRVPRHEPASIQGFSRHRIRGQVFPGTVRSQESASSVQGLVLFELQPRELEVGLAERCLVTPVPDLAGGCGWLLACSTSRLLLCLLPHCSQSQQMLDEFEGDEYTKEAVTATLLPQPGSSSSGSGDSVETFVYLWQDALQGYLYSEWDPQHFRRDGRTKQKGAAAVGRLHAVAIPPPDAHTLLCVCPPSRRDTELERYVQMCSLFAADVRKQRGWKGTFEASPPAEDGSAAAGGQA